MNISEVFNTVHECLCVRAIRNIAHAFPLRSCAETCLWSLSNRFLDGGGGVLVCAAPDWGCTPIHHPLQYDMTAHNFLVILGVLRQSVVMNSNRWFILAVAALIVATYVSTQCRDRYFKDGSIILDKWSGESWHTSDGKLRPKP